MNYHPEPLRFFVAGVQHCPGATLVDAKSGDDIKLIGEPSNKYDRFAVRVEWNGKKIGYIPKGPNMAVWAARDAGFKPVAVLTAFYPGRQPWLMFDVEVAFTKIPSTSPNVDPLAQLPSDLSEHV